MTGSAEQHDGWRAMRYLLDEMSTAERSEFETELAENDSLCDELTDAVELLNTTSVALKEQAVSVPTATGDVVRRTGRSGQVLRWMAVGLAAATIVFVVDRQGGFDGLRFDRRNAVEQVAMSQASQLVARWRDSSIDVDESDVSSVDDAADDSLLIANYDPEFDAAGSVDPLETPSWLAAAVARRYGTASADGPLEN